jgi:outer membrane receptor protein involved in Fe transport
MLRLLRRLFLLGLATVATLIPARAEDDDAEEAAARARKTAAVSAKLEGVVSGTIVDRTSEHPVEYVAVTLKKTDGTVVQSTVSDQRGHFIFEKIPAGDYTLDYNAVGADRRTTAPFRVDPAHARVELPALSVATDVLQLEKLEVKGKQAAFLNTIDRKTYNVGKEIQSTTGSASDLLQNLPSVQVDIDGNVSLRGSDNVMILINGRTSTLMGRSRAEVLQQLPADSIDRIEVITNPSAKYKPDGTAGIINIVMKKKHDGGFSGTANAAAGNDGRGNGGVSLNYNPGPYNVFASVSLRKDDRPRRATDIRTTVDPLTGVTSSIAKTTVEQSRPLTRLARGGFDWNVSAEDKLGAAFNYNRRTFLRHATDHNVVSDAAGIVTGDYDRTRTDPEYEQSQEGSATWQHTFAEEGHELNAEFKYSTTREQEDNHYVNSYRSPVQPATYDNMLNQNSGHERETSVEYVRPLGDAGKLEAGYALTDEDFQANFHIENLDPLSGRFVTDAAKSNRFNVARTIHAFYGTWSRTVGPFGFMAGLRPELATVTSHLVNTGTTVPNDYNRVYPTLHLAWQAAAGQEVQLNYSHRVHRPEIDDLNPFPEYIDPFNLRAGNPRLKPEDTHSLEGGYSLHEGDNSLTATVYHRELYHGFTTVTRDLGNNVLLTTRENLAVSRSTGVELTADAELGKRLTLNFSSNTFFNTIDASNLGFSSAKSDVSWTAKLGGTLKLGKATRVQFNTNYASTRLTPQGSRRPSFVANAGVRHELAQKKAAVVLTVSDLFNSLKETTDLDTPALRERIVRRRSARIVYLGLVYNFGLPTKKAKDDSLKFDNSL